MNRKVLYGIWALGYILCGALGHIAEPTGGQAVAMTVLSVLFFVPGALLLVDAFRKDCKAGLLRVRWISAISLGLTFVALLANILCAGASETVGNVFYVLLIWVSAPMICSRYWILSLFLWACLLFATFLKKDTKR